MHMHQSVGYKVLNILASACWALASAELRSFERAGRSLQFPINIHTHTHTHLHEDMYNTQTQIHTLQQHTESVTGNTAGNQQRE